jgi:putative membrane protein
MGTILRAGVCGICTVLFCAMGFSRPRARTEPFNAQDFVNVAAQADMLQAHIGQMADTHSSLAAVRDLGSQISQQSQRNYQKLGVMAAKLGLSMPRAIDAEGIRTIKRLDGLRGPEFNREFAREEIAAGEREVAAYQRAAQEAQNPDLKQFAATALSNLQLNLQETKDFQHYDLSSHAKK